MKHLVAAILVWTMAVDARAHLMVEQHATLNFVDDGAFLVISAPVTAFTGIDENDDGMLSAQEMGKHINTLRQQIHDGVKLLDRSGNQLPLQGLMLSLSHPHDDPGGPANHVIALGRFAVGDSMSPLTMEISLCGEAPDEQVFHVTATRNGASRKMTFTPASSRHEILPG